MLDSTYNIFMIQSAEGRRRTILNYDDETVNEDKTLFGRINGAPRCVIALYSPPPNNRRKRSDGKENQQFIKASARSSGIR